MGVVCCGREESSSSVSRAHNVFPRGAIGEEGGIAPHDDDHIMPSHKQLQEWRRRRVHLQQQREQEQLKAPPVMPPCEDVQHQHSSKQVRPEAVEALATEITIDFSEVIRKYDESPKTQSPKTWVPDAVNPFLSPSARGGSTDDVVNDSSPGEDSHSLPSSEFQPPCADAAAVIPSP